MSATLEQIQSDMSSKYSSERYSANAVLDSVREDGHVTVWRIQYSYASSGKRCQEFDILIQHDARTNVSGVSNYGARA